jgi:hypothetical protein
MGGVVRKPVGPGAALLAVAVAAFIGMVIVLAEALVRWAARLNPKKP